MVDNMQMPGQMGQAMEKKVGGKMSIGQYFGVVKKWYMWLLIGAVVVGLLSLIPNFAIISIAGILGIAVWAFGVYVLGTFGYKLAKERNAEIKDALIGGAILGGVLGVINGVFSLISGIIIANVLTTSIFGVGYGIAGTWSIFSLISGILWGVIGGLVISLVGFAIGGGFNKTGAPR